MAEAWSRIEVEATVSAYLEMLDLELREEPYSKADSRRHLLPLLNGRSEGAIERKHQNISAILIELGCPYIAGYKPLRNYQQLLFDVVDGRLQGNAPLIASMKESATAPAAAPSVDDILRRLVDPPKRDETKRDVVRDAPRPIRRVDYLAIEARNRSLGAAGEEFIVNFEVARLPSERAKSLAAKVERVSETRGDGLGFDILSFEASGRERFIEVKTTAYGNETPFYVTRNEVETSERLAPDYHIYRVYEFRKDPRLFVRQGAIARGFDLEAVEWLARP